MAYRIFPNQPHLKGTFPYPLLCDRSAGAVPFSMVLEDELLPAPEVESWFLLAYPGDRQNDTGTIEEDVTNYVEGESGISYDVTFSPTTGAAIAIASPLLASNPAALHIRPHAAQDSIDGFPLRYGNKVDLQDGTMQDGLLISDAWLGLFRDFTPTLPGCGVQVNRFARVQGGAYLVGQDYYESHWLALTPNGSGFSCVSVGNGNSNFGHQIAIPDYGHGWTYAVQLDQETGVVAGAIPTPEAWTFRAPLGWRSGYGLIGGGQGAVAAITWPTGVRRAYCYIGAGYPLIDETTAWNAKIYWREAGSWVYHAEVSSNSIATVTWTNVTPDPSTAVGLAVGASFFGADHGGLSRAVYGSEFYPDGGGPTGSGWTLLATISGTGHGIHDIAISGTQPAAGQDVFLAGGTDLYEYEEGSRFLEIAIFPEPSESPVPIAKAFGGVLGGA